MQFLKRTRARARLISAVTPATSSQCPSSVQPPPEFPPHSTICSLSRQVTIENLSDKTLLKIFCYFLDDSPRHWPTTLVHICRKWRRIVFASQRALQLRLFCTHGTPVLKTIDCLPALPIVVQYGGSPALDPPAPEDEDNIRAALTHSDRISSISLTITSSLLEKLSAIEESFSDLEDLVLLSQNGAQLTLPSTFQWGPRLRCLNSTRVTFPSLLQLLDSSKNLVDLHLHEVLDPSCFPPEALTNAFSGMDQLQSLSLHFPSDGNHLTPPPPSRELVVLPALTRLNFQGTTEYLERLVARIDTPLLGNIEVTFVEKSNYDLTQLCKFTTRIGMHRSPRRADILSSEHAVSISLTRPGDSTRLKFQSFCKPLGEQLFIMARIFYQFSAFLYSVEDLRFTAQRPSRQGNALYCERWLEPINSFIGVKWLYVSGNLWNDIVCSLQLRDKRPESVLPALHKLCILQPGPRHAPLSEAVVSLMTSRRLSGHPIAVEYERLCGINELHGTGHFCQQATIEMLSEDILLNIFRHNLGATPRFWPTLASVCKIWRQIVLTSPLGLNLRLFCTHGTPVFSALDCWPVLPIIIQYGGFPNLKPPAPQDDDNIIAALKKSGRVSSINLTVTSSLLGKLSVLSEPFSELEELALLSRDNMQLTLPSTFRWGHRLRTLHSTGIAFPSLPRLLLPSQDLVDIQLHDIPNTGYFSPETFANALSGMTQLRSLTLHLVCFTRRRSLLVLPPPPGERIILPALTNFKYRGISKYLDSLVARIDAPCLGDIEIAFFSQPTMDASELGRFIERIEMQTPISRGEVQTSEHAISISFTNSNTSNPLRLRISCKQLDWQLSCMAQVCDQFSPFLFRVEELSLYINSTQTLRAIIRGQDDASDERWLDLLRSFGNVRDISVAGKLATVILCALRPNGDTSVLPSLRHLRVQEPVVMHGPLWDAVQSFITSQPISGRLVQLDAPSYQCHIQFCRFKSEEPQGLKRHLRDKHRYQIMCSYCCDFEPERTPGRNDLFREHLESKHPEVVRMDALILSPSTTRFQPDGLLNRHSSLRAPDTGTPPQATTTGRRP